MKAKFNLRFLLDRFGQVNQNGESRSIWVDANQSDCCVHALNTSLGDSGRRGSQIFVLFFGGLLTTAKDCALGRSVLHLSAY
jgi:hypothetical protein